jgi:hypothetical protein
VKRNIPFVFIILLIVVLIFSVALTCGPLDEYLGFDHSNADENALKVAPEKAVTSENASSDPNLINGVIPTKVKAAARDEDTKDEGIMEFWNVGKLGGEQYSKATYTIIRDGKTIQTYEGYFTGGPNGEIFLNSGDKNIHGKLVDGKVFTGDDFSFMDISNPEAFSGWTDNTAKKVSVIISFFNGVISNPINSSESDFFSKLTLEQGLVDSSGNYLLGGEQTVDGCTGNMSGTYNPNTRQYAGKYWDQVSIPTIHKPDEEYIMNGTFSEEIGQSGQVTLKLEGTKIHKKYTYGEDGTDVWSETLSNAREVTFTVTGLD